ncbi:AzlD domain-containing protein [Kribbella sp. NBC_01245]|uniref:AzlD domain-containing protein n=1 Tax=Kribbella sp. NBC_01245 TaxID=2903578 RepID=UPI002E2E8458|nr:AzlD domain-containing protein [Kribbella sp. NBC_01245]
MPLVAILVLAAGTYAFRLAGPVFHERVQIPERWQELLSVAAVVLLLSLVATGAVMDGQSFAGWSRLAGVAVGAVLALRKAPFPLIVIAAVATTALLRLAGLE